MREDDGTMDNPTAVEDRGQADPPAIRTRHCWEIVRQLPGLHFNCEECYAYFVQQDCWSLWALRRPGFKPCCQKKGDCAECAILIERMRPQADQQLEIARRKAARPVPATAKRICSYLQLYSSGELVEGDSRSAQIARALQMRNADFRCRLRGVHLDMGYVNDVCVSRQVDECVFLDEDRPEVHLRPLPMLKSAPSGEKPAQEKGVSAPDVSDPSASSTPHQSRTTRG